MACSTRIERGWKVGRGAMCSHANGQAGRDSAVGIKSEGWRSRVVPNRAAHSGASAVEAVRAASTAGPAASHGRQQPWCDRGRGAHRSWPAHRAACRAGRVRGPALSPLLAASRAAALPDLRVCCVRHQGEASSLAHDAGAHAVGHARKQEQEDGVLERDVQLYSGRRWTGG